MTTKAQLEAFDASKLFMGSIEWRAYGAIRNAGEAGATVDEAYRLAYPLHSYSHSRVDSFRVAIRHLRERGAVMDSGAKRMSLDSGKAQAVWVIGDDRDLVAQHRRAKLRHFDDESLADELRSRGWTLEAPEPDEGRLFP